MISEVFRRRDELALSFTDRDPNDFDFIVEVARTDRSLFDDYLEQNESHGEVDPNWMTRSELSHYHLCAIGTRPMMEAFEQDVLAQIPDQVQTFVQKSPRYAGTMCEILRHDANKWNAVCQIARSWNIEDSDICAIGDDMNDLPMIRAAGLGVAMGHSNSLVLAAADHVTGSDDEDGVAVFIEDFLLA